MLKSVSSITNAIGALNFKGTWDANANSPALASSVGTKGDYYVVGTAGSTNLNGISNWGVGDLATFNGSVWQRVEGGADLNGVNLSVSGTSTLSGLTASTALALNASKEIVSVTNTGTGNNVLATAPTLVDDVSLSTGNLVIGTSGKGIDFSITSHPAGMTSELLSDYEEGTWTPVFKATGTNLTSVTYATQSGKYTKIGRQVTVSVTLRTSAITIGAATGVVVIDGLPFTAASAGTGIVSNAFGWAGDFPIAGITENNFIYLNYRTSVNGRDFGIEPADLGLGANANDMVVSVTYFV
jgi:hypothetical protein